MALILFLAWVFWVVTGPWAGGLFDRPALLSRKARLSILMGGYAAMVAVSLIGVAQGAGAAGLFQWLTLGLIFAVVWAYTRWIGQMRKRADSEEAESPAPPKPGTLSDAELNRYARHIVLREIGGLGQKRLSQAKVLVIGAGGLGSPALQYLAASGVGTIGIIDDDVVDLTNLQRQIIHTDDRIGEDKVRSAQLALRALNPHIDIRPYKRRLTEEIAADLVAEYDVILDGTDNFDTRYLSNRAAVAAGKPLVSGALSQWEGQVSVFDPAQDAPCYACVFPQAPAEGLAPSCAEAGVLSPLPGVIGTMMAVETVKLITGAGQPLRGEMLIYDALWGETRKITLRRRADCPVCSG